MPYVRIAEIGIDRTQGERYRAELREEIEASIRREPGVLALQAVSDGADPTRIIGVSRRPLSVDASRRSVHEALTKYNEADANSAIERAPTIRPLPFRVWKLRRRELRAPKSIGFWSQSGKHC